MLPVERKRASVRKEDRCSFRHETQDRAQKPEHTAATPSEPALSRGRSVSGKRSIRGKSNHGSIARTTVQILFEGYLHANSLWKISIRPSANSIKQKRVERRERRVCLLIAKIDEHQNKKLKQGHFPKRRESEDKGVLAIAQSVSQLGYVSQDSDALVSQGTREFRGDPMQKVLNAIRKVRFTKSTLRHASIREKKGPSLGKINVKVLISEVPTLGNLRTGL